jgi:hypothetical protein
MKKLLRNNMLKVVFVLLLSVVMGNVSAQTSIQNFGTGTGSHTSSTGSTIFLPAPTSGTTWARAGAVVPNAPITLSNTSNPLGTTGSYARGTASSSGAVSKLSPMIGYTGSTEFYTSFKVLFGDAAAGATASTGSWTFYQGAGVMYSDANDFTGAQVFASLRFTYAAAGALALTTRQGANFVNTGLSPASFTQGTVYTIEIVGNNKASGTINYNYAGVAQTVAVQKYDLYINGSLVGNDIAEAALPAGTSITSTTFIGISSTSNAANVFVDDVTVYNAIPGFINVAAPIIPNAPVVSNPQTNSLDVTIDSNAQNGNGSTIQYAIQETTTSNYVQANGTLGVSPVWQTAATWGTVNVNGLNSNTLYTFRLNARNIASIESGFGATASGTTTNNVAANLSLVSPLAGFGSVCTNATANGSFMFDGANLNGSDIVVNSLAGYSYSLTQNGTYTSTLNISYVGSSIDDQVVWVKFAPSAVQSYNGNIALSGAGLAANYNVAVTGNGINTAVSVTTGSASGTTAVQATASGTLTQGCSSITAYGIEYSTTNNFVNGTGTQVAASNLLAGAFSSVLTGLAPVTTYYFRAYATDITGTVYGGQQSFITGALTAPDATDATNIQQTQFTANWTAVPGASSYRLDVSTLPNFGTTQNATDLFFSEYVEGSSNNKYIEIYNGTGAAVNLADYQLRLYANGAVLASPTTSVTLSGTLANGATIVYRNSSASAYGGAATDSGAANFNGDDALALYKISTASLVDIFGTIGQDPGTAWTAAGGYTTLDKTLVRNANVFGGITTNPGNGFPTLATQWTVSNIDVVTNLGSHTINNFTPSFISGYENKTVNGTSDVVSGPEIVAETTYYYRVRAFSANSTSGNSDVIQVTTALAPPTFGSISQVIAVVCDGSDATFNVNGLLPDNTSTLTFNINGGLPQTADVIANASGFGTFDHTLVAANNGQVLTVTSVDRTDAPGNPLTVTTNNTVILNVNAYVTYYRDFDNDTYGDPFETTSSCTGAPVGYVPDNTDCDDDNNAAHAVYLYYEDNDGDSYGSTTSANICAANPLVAPTGYSTNDDDCNDNASTAYPGAAEIGYNLTDDDCDGFTDEGFPPKVTIIQGAQCNTTLAAIDTQIVANLVAGAQGYRWRVTTLTGPTAGQVQELDTALRVIRLTQLVNYAFATQYKIEVAVYYAGFLQPYNASSCNVSTPATTTQLSVCGQSLSVLTNPVYATIVPFATGYRFRITDPINGANTQVIERPIREFRMTQITNFIVQYNKTYNVEVSVKNTDGTWLLYGQVCTVTTPAFPTTSLQDSQCEDYMVPTSSTQIYAISYPGAIAYVFQITGPGIVTPLEVTKSVRTFTLNDFPGLIAGATYNVRVRLVFNLSDPAGPFGKTCTIVTPGLARQAVSKSAFDVTAYPNPFADNFTIAVNGASSEDVKIAVYDMTGRLLDNVTVKSSQVDAVQTGGSYPSGVYNVIVTQGDNTKTIRLIKR